MTATEVIEGQLRCATAINFSEKLVKVQDIQFILNNWNYRQAGVLITHPIYADPEIARIYSCESTLSVYKPLAEFERGYYNKIA